MNTITFRKIGIADLHAVMQVDQECFKCDPYPEYLWDYFLIAGWSFGAFDNDQLVGFISSAYQRDIWGRDYANFEIVSFGVKKDYRKRGIGKTLLLKMLDKLAPFNRKIELHVRVTNPIIKLYESVGFEIVDTLVHYYSKEDDAYTQVPEGLKNVSAYEMVYAPRKIGDPNDINSP